MNKILNTDTNIHAVRAAEMDAAYAEGFRYICEGNYRTTDTTDPWTGMPYETCDVFVFTDKAEAEAFAATQKMVFNNNHAEVFGIPEHTKTWEEREAERETEREAEKAKKLAKEIAKAEAAGMTLEQYREEKKAQAKMKRYKKEIEEYERLIAKYQEEIEFRKKWIAEREN